MPRPPPGSFLQNGEDALPRPDVDVFRGAPWAHTSDWGLSENGNDKNELNTTKSWSLIDVDTNLRHVIINYNKTSNMALQLSQHHCCIYPHTTGYVCTEPHMDDGMMPEERTQYEGQVLEEHLEDAHGSTELIKLLETSFRVEPGLAFCSYDETRWIGCLNVFLEPEDLEDWLLEEHWPDHDAYNEAVRPWRRYWGLPQDMEMCPREISYEHRYRWPCRYE
jgi:hypothetical protein